jgi:hypothetical protein
MSLQGWGTGPVGACLGPKVLGPRSAGAQCAWSASVLGGPVLGGASVLEGRTSLEGLRVRAFSRAAIHPGRPARHPRAQDRQRGDCYGV